MTRIFRPSAAVPVALMLLAVSAPLGAHHGTNISYDRSKQFTTQAVVKSFEYRNPHPELHVEFKVPKGSNSGVYMMGQYEIQIFDSFGKKENGPGDVGSIYSVAVAKQTAATAPGERQTLDVVF